jgi:hypothetical protein
LLGSSCISDGGRLNSAFDDQDKDDDDGLELYVRSQINRNDVDWFPDGICMSIKDKDDEDDKLDVAALEQGIVQRVQKHQDTNNDKVVRELKELRELLGVRPASPRA